MSDFIAYSYNILDYFVTYLRRYVDLFIERGDVLHCVIEPAIALLFVVLFFAVFRFIFNIFKRS